MQEEHGKKALKLPQSSFKSVENWKPLGICAIDFFRATQGKLMELI